MAKTDNLTDFLTGVASAIRTAEDSISAIDPQDFEDRIIALAPSNYTADADATEEQIAQGKVAYVKGNRIVGNMDSYGGNNDEYVLGYGNSSYEIPEGFHFGDEVVYVKIAQRAKPTISINGNTGLITASVKQEAGCVDEGIQSDTKKLTIKGETIYIPTTDDQIIERGTYCTGVQTIKGDSSLIPSNIKKGETIFGIPGEYEGEGGSLGTDTCTVRLGLSSMSYWHPEDRVRVFYKAYENGSMRVKYIETDATESDYATLSNIICGSEFFVYTEMCSLIDPGEYELFSDEYRHCLICPNAKGQTITINMLEAS